MKLVFILIFSLIGSLYSQYCAGEQISIADQNISHEVCAGFEDYEVGDSFSLADYNGDLNGGDYHIIFIDMSASWWGTCYSYGVPAVDALEEEWEEYGVKFIASLQDPGQPYSCSAWQSAGTPGMPLVIDENQSSTGFFSLLHDSWSAFPTFALIDHTMTVRAKPWTLENNSNSNSCDGSNSSISGWSGGDTSDFIEQLVEECGDLCINGGCSTAAGDSNEDGILNIQDIITMVNHILGSSIVADCALEASDMNMDSIVNIQDLISLVNAILGSSRSAALDGKAEVALIPSDDDLVIRIDSDINIAGVQLSLLDDMPLEIKLKDNSHISQESNFIDGVNHYLAYSMFNQTFDGKVTDIFVSSAGHLSKDEIVITVADVNGDKLELTYGSDGYKYQDGIVRSFELSELYPNPFNPATEVSFYIPSENSHVKLSAYDIRGQEVGIIFEGTQSSGWHHYTWNASGLPSGVYYVHLQAGSMIATQKAVLIK